ncbi:hypothetical protein AXG93_4773s1060 [Marchantia polymorpha subsp. ruderalis]|uniref:Uncharacterized protein n=1 Tax=Marchantia polymorpha subsp. ruderalis TaxID=1480154 RepID=A0A176WKH7_MARPO|nr:hypothetical protein AXG93_4773s1060 [Marchantia polymorpha subsp. ruderalis]
MIVSAQSGTRADRDKVTEVNWSLFRNGTTSTLKQGELEGSFKGRRICDRIAWRWPVAIDTAWSRLAAPCYPRERNQRPAEGRASARRSRFAPAAGAVDHPRSIVQSGPSGENYGSFLNRPLAEGVLHGRLKGSDRKLGLLSGACQRWATIFSSTWLVAPPCAARCSIASSCSFTA